MHSSILLDESTSPGNEPILLAYVCFVMGQGFDERLSLLNIISAAADGAPAIFGRYRGFISNLKQNVRKVFGIHCFIYGQHLVLVPVVINAVNKIRSDALIIGYLCRCGNKMMRMFMDCSFTMKCTDCQKVMYEFLNVKDKILE